MPDRIYLPLDARHIRRRDRLWAHWYAFCATLGSAGLGLLIMVTSIIRWHHPYAPDLDGDGVIDPPWSFTDWHKWLNPAPSLAALPQWQGFAIGLALFLGGALWTIATLTSFDYVEDFWKWLRGGLTLLIFGWMGYVLCALYMRPEWVVPWWLGLTHAIAYLGGFYLSMHHQWRLKGYPDWVLKTQARWAPAYTRLCDIAAVPFIRVEGIIRRHTCPFKKKKRGRI